MRFGSHHKIIKTRRFKDSFHKKAVFKASGFSFFILSFVCWDNPLPGFLCAGITLFIETMLFIGRIIYRDNNSYFSGRGGRTDRSDQSRRRRSSIRLRRDRGKHCRPKAPAVAAQ